MDEEMEDFVEDYYVEAVEIDWDYEFDAARFFDFSRPESFQEDEDAERWFEIAGNYPASPLVAKLGRGGRIQGEDTVASSSLDDGKSNSTDVDIGSEGSPSNDKMGGTEGAMKTKPIRSSTLMKPTASHLAKVNKARDLHSSHICGRLQKSSIHKNESRLQKSPGLDNLATKRQKLEIGYLRKVSHLKHQALLLHKKSQKDGNITPKTAHSKTNVTIPKEPELETLQRALSRRSRTNSESSERSESENFRSGFLNRKIFKAPTIFPSKKSKPQPPVFQAFNLKTAERALRRSFTNEVKTHNSDIISQSDSADLKRSCIMIIPTEVKKICKTSNSDNAVKQEKYETPLQIKVRSVSNKIFPTKEDTGGIKSVREDANETELRKDQRLSQSPPTELFNKLSLRSELRSDTVSQLNSHVSNKGSKENAPDCFQPEFWKCVGKVNQCGSSRAIPGIVYDSNMHRSLIIR